jgi:Putative esterase.
MRAIVYHGRGSSPEKVDWLVEPLRGLGYEVVAPSIRDVADAYEIGLSSLPVGVAAGHSMGGTAALLLAARNPGQGGLRRVRRRACRQEAPATVAGGQGR